MGISKEKHLWSTSTIDTDAVTVGCIYVTFITFYLLISRKGSIQQKEIYLLPILLTFMFTCISVYEQITICK